MMQFLRSRNWVVTRRLFLAAVVLVLAYRNYGDALTSRFRGPNPQQDILITHSEFRPGLPDARPGWIIVFRNQSPRHTYDKIKVEATYLDDAGTMLEKDTLVIDQKLTPGGEQIIGSLDAKDRGAATHGTLRVLDAEAQ